MPKPVTVAAFRALRTLPGRTCLHAMEIARLTKAERREYDDGLADFSIQLPAIHRVLTERGLRVNMTSLHSHRHRRCRHCFGAR